MNDSSHSPHQQNGGHPTCGGGLGRPRALQQTSTNTTERLSLNREIHLIGGTGRGLFLAGLISQVYADMHRCATTCRLVSIIRSGSISGRVEGRYLLGRVTKYTYSGEEFRRSGIHPVGEKKISTASQSGAASVLLI